MRECIFALLETNMRAMYEQVGTWDPHAKKGELQHRTSRFLLVFDKNVQNRTRRRSPRNSAQAGRAQDLLGFVMWRYDVDETNNDDICADPGDDMVEVSYCYEVQVDAAARGRQIGTMMLAILEHLSWKAGMRKVALTLEPFIGGAATSWMQRRQILDKLWIPTISS
ncbi:N-terminal L-serine N(alpha)-acetyltransferase NatD [Malassezia nana]|uniref:N-terminal L-serine N(Alpha)-acetyltransferase NatD n=1 Tax=Malassezia nana TaxID=180528 RepID=A0AAF0EJT6_9BASI|nr:N-terminal L-serine N(alpha)-acetyltransferase NatD [Malassezia nana]